MITNTITKLVGIYCRVSTAGQEEEKTIQNQIMEICDLAEKNNYTIVEKYLDDGWSGDILARPAMDRLREDAKKKKWEAVLVYDPDRIARRYSYQELIMDELIEAGIEIIFITIPAPKNPEEKILHGVRGLFAEYERAKITERFRLGKLRKAREGHVLVSEAPYGYNYVPKKGNEQGYLEINEEEARVVRMIFNWVVEERLTVYGIIKRLHELGIKPRRNRREVWSTSTLCTLLRRTTYIGNASYLRSYAIIPENPLKKERYKRIKKTSRKIRPKEEWINIPAPAILDKEVFDRAKEVLKKNISLRSGNRRYDYLLSGKVYCTCGCKRTGESIKKGENLYYRCTDRIYNYPLPRKCFETGIDAKIADNLVWNEIKKIMSSPDLIIKEASKWEGKKEKIESVSDTSISELEKELEKLKKEEERYLSAYGLEVISLEQLKEQNIKIKKKSLSLRKQIAHLEESNTNPKNVNLPSEDRLKDFCQKAKKMLNCLSFKVKQEIINELIEKITGNKKEMIVEGYLPIDQNYYVEFKTIDRNSRPSKRRQINLLQNSDKKTG